MAIWETLLAGTAPVVVTSGALIYQQHRTDKKDTQRLVAEARAREEERVAAAVLRLEERTNVEHEHHRRLDDEWREQRRAAHVTLLALLDEAYALVRPAVIAAPLWRPGDAVPTPFTPERRHDLLRAYIEVTLVATSEGAALRAKSALSMLFHVERLLRRREVPQGPVMNSEDMPGLDQMRIMSKSYEWDRSNYADEARADLGLARLSRSENDHLSGPHLAFYD